MRSMTKEKTEGGEEGDRMLSRTKEKRGGRRGEKNEEYDKREDRGGKE